MANTSKDTEASYTKTSRCWPGYEPVPGKSEHEEGSCRKKPASRNGGKEVDRETARKKQIKQGGTRAEQAKSKSPSAAERAKARQAKAKKAAGKKSASNRSSANKKASSTVRTKSASSRGAKKATAKTSARKSAAGHSGAKRTVASK